MTGRRRYEQLIFWHGQFQLPSLGREPGVIHAELAVYHARPAEGEMAEWASNECTDLGYIWAAFTGTVTSRL